MKRSEWKGSREFHVTITTWPAKIFQSIKESQSVGSLEPNCKQHLKQKGPTFVSKIHKLVCNEFI